MMKAELRATFAILLKDDSPLVVDIHAPFEAADTVKDLIEILRSWGQDKVKPPPNPEELRVLLENLDETINGPLARYERSSAAKKPH